MRNSSGLMKPLLLSFCRVTDLGDLDLKREKVTFRRAEEGMSHAKLPTWLTVGRIPDEAAAEIEGFFAYIKKKYGL